MRIFFTDARGNPIFGFRRRKAAVPIFASVVANHSSSNSHGGGGGSSSPNTATKSPPPPPVAPIRSTLFFHILNRNWEWVVRRARTHPQEIHQYDSRTGDMPLHAACRLNPPVAAIRALLAVNHHNNSHTTTTRRFSFSKPSSKAEATTAQAAAELHYNSDGWNALHVAASNQCSRQVLEVLVEYAPHAVQQLTRKTKRTPIHCAAAASFRGLDRHAFFYLLNVSLQQQQQQQQEQQQATTVPEDEDLDQESADGNPAAANHHSKSLLCWKDSTGQTPLALLFRRYRERVKHVCQQMDQLRLSRNEALALVQTELGPLWDKARGMVERLSAVLSSSSSSLAMLPSEVDYPLVHEDIDLGTAVTGFGAVPNHHHHARHDPQQPLASLLKARSRSSLQGRRFRLVHASVGLIGFGCPPEMIRLAVSLYPHQAAEVDEDGNLPLLIAARRFQQEQQEAAAAAAAAAADVLSVGLDDLSLHTHLNGAQLQHSSPHGLHNSFGNNNNNGDNWDTMSIFSEATTAASTIAGFSSKKSPWDQVFDMLLQQYPRAAGMPQQQSAAADTAGNDSVPSAPPPQDTTLPLAVAMKSCNSFMSWRRDGLERLYHAHPPALHMVLEQQQEAQLKRDDDDSNSNNNNNHGGRALYPHLLALLLAKDQQHLHVLRGGRRSIRMNANLRRRTPLDIARMSSVFWLLQTKPEMLESLPLSTSP